VDEICSAECSCYEWPNWFGCAGDLDLGVCADVREDLVVA